MLVPPCMLADRTKGIERIHRIIASVSGSAFAEACKSGSLNGLLQRHKILNIEKQCVRVVEAIDTGKNELLYPIPPCELALAFQLFNLT